MQRQGESINRAAIVIELIVNRALNVNRVCLNAYSYWSVCYNTRMWRGRSKVYYNIILYGSNQIFFYHSYAFILYEQARKQNPLGHTVSAEYKKLLFEQ